jgi:hypothetical protein
MNLILSVGLAYLSTNTIAHTIGRKIDLLHAWMSNDVAGDHLATIDYNPKSPKYGSVVNRAFLPKNVPSISITSNEAHHIAISNDKAWILTAGLGSFLQGTDQIFIWKVVNQIQYLNSINHSMSKD